MKKGDLSIEDWLSFWSPNPDLGKKPMKLGLYQYGIWTFLKKKELGPSFGQVVLLERDVL